MVIGACELRAGTAFRFGNERSGSWRHGEVAGNDLALSFAVAASAAYPIFLPAFDRTFEFQKKDMSRRARVSLTDGGVHDNLGIQVLEPGRDSNFSLHTFPCDYILSCNAGQGQEAGLGVPLALGTRVKRAFEVVHRRVQDATMHHLHRLKESGKLRGFAMPYLGQQDAVLPRKPSVLVPRDKVIDYPTDFAAMASPHSRIAPSTLHPKGWTIAAAAAYWAHSLAESGKESAATWPALSRSAMLRAFASARTGSLNVRKRGLPPSWKQTRHRGFPSMTLR